MKLYRAPLFCACYWRPNLEFTAAMVDLARTVPPETLLGTWACERKRCKSIGHVTAGQVARAVPVRDYVYEKG